MTECGSCAGEVLDGWICGRCCTDLRDMLGSLPPRYDEAGRRRSGLLDYLTDSSTGQTRLGKPSRRARGASRSLDGDDFFDALVVVESGTTASGGKYFVERPKYTLPRALSAKRINERAADLLREIGETLEAWARHVTITHGLIMTPSVTALWATEHTTSDYATFLSQHVGRIAVDKNAGQLVHDIRRYVRRAENVINRPAPPKFLGPCPTSVGHRKQCATRLEAPPKATSVKCPSCGTVHDVEKLLKDLLLFLKDKRGTSAELRQLLTASGHHLPKGTLDAWVFRRKLRPVGWLRADGNRGIRKRSDKDSPVYLMADLISLMGIGQDEEIPA